MNRLPPHIGSRKGVCPMNLFLSFLLSIMASVIAYYVCKWLDKRKQGSQPKA